MSSSLRGAVVDGVLSPHASTSSDSSSELGSSPHPSSASALSVGAADKEGDESSLLSALLSQLAVLSSTGVLSHLELLARQADSMETVNQLPPLCEQIHLGVVPLPAFRALMAILNAIRRHQPAPSSSGASAELQSAERAEHLSSSHSRTVSPQAAVRHVGHPLSSSVRHEEGMDISFVNGFVHTALMEAEEEAAMMRSASSFLQSAEMEAAEAARAPSAAGAQLPSGEPAGDRTSVPPAPPSPVPLAAAERDRFCKPSRLITAYPSKPFLMTPIHLERQYVTSRKNLDGMSVDEKSELSTVTVRWMGRPALDELFLVATDVCALINIRKSNTAKTVAQFSDAEKVSMPVHCSSGKGSSTHILTVLTMAGVRRLLSNSRSILSSALLDYLSRITAHIYAYPHYVPVNDPTKPSVQPYGVDRAASLAADMPTAAASFAHSESTATSSSAQQAASSSTPVKAEDGTAPRSWARSPDRAVSVPVLQLRSSSSPAAESRSHAYSSAPSQSSHASPPSSTRASLSGRKQQRQERPKKDAQETQHLKRMKEEQLQQHEERLLSLNDAHRPDERDEHLFLHGAAYSAHAADVQAVSSPLPPPSAFHSASAYQSHSPTLSMGSYSFPPHHPHCLAASLSPSFGPSSAAAGFLGSSLDYHAPTLPQLNAPHYYAHARPLSPSSSFALAYYEAPRAASAGAALPGAMLQPRAANQPQPIALSSAMTRTMHSPTQLHCPVRPSPVAAPTHLPAHGHSHYSQPIGASYGCGSFASSSSAPLSPHAMQHPMHSSHSAEMMHNH